MIDLSKTVAPKSDQLNADDLISGPKIITVTAVKLVAEDQPVAIHFQGDDGKPYKPCKSMRRVLIRAWGPDGAKYVGRAMTLFLDEAVRFGGAAVGGIRISHLSHIDKPITMALTVTRANKKAFTVAAMGAMPDSATITEKEPAPKTMPEEVVAEWLDDMQRAERAADLKTVFGTAWKAAGSVGDSAAKSQFKSAYDRRMAELEIR